MYTLLGSTLHRFDISLKHLRGGVSSQSNEPQLPLSVHRLLPESVCDLKGRAAGARFGPECLRPRLPDFLHFEQEDQDEEECCHLHPEQYCM